MQNLLHAIGFHQWSKWNEIHEYNIIRDGRTKGIGKMYERHCRICNKPQSKKIITELVQ